MDYVCKPDVGCYSTGSPSTNAQFLELQNFLNRFTAVASLNLKLVQVDGILGPESASAANRIALALSRPTGPNVSAGLRQIAAQIAAATASPTGWADPELLAKNAASILAFLQRGAVELDLAYVAPPPKPARPVPSSGEATVPATFFDQFPTKPASDRRTYALAGLGALLAGAAIFGAYRYLTRKPRSDSPVMGLTMGPPPYMADWTWVVGTDDYRAPDGRIATRDAHGFTVRDARGRVLSVGRIVDLANRTISARAH